jgi:hypothetical protein
VKFMKTEYVIHDLIRTYPYLLGTEFEGLILKHEKTYDDRSRADFVFSNGTISIVVEVKIGNMDIQTIIQALHYLNMEKKENPQKSLLGLLIGHQIVNREEFEEKMANSKYEFKIKFLDNDIPTEFKLCDGCRKVNNIHTTKCKFCGSKKFITDPFQG